MTVLFLEFIQEDEWHSVLFLDDNSEMYGKSLVLLHGEKYKLWTTGKFTAITETNENR